MTSPPTLADLVADPGELDVSCLDCHHNTTMPAAALLPRYAAETPFPEVWGGFRCSACGSRHVDVRPHWAARSDMVGSGMVLHVYERLASVTRYRNAMQYTRIARLILFLA